jgi:hypothetical protein
MALTEKGDYLEIRITFNLPRTGQDLLDVAKGVGYLADRTGVAPADIEIGDHEYDDDKKVAAWGAEGLG